MEKKERTFIRTIAVTDSVLRKAKEIGDGNISRGFREAVERVHVEWEREQASKWMERAQAVLKDGEA